MEYHIQEAKERQREAGGDHGNQYTGGKVAVSATMQQPPEEKKPFASNQNTNKAAAKAGKIFDVSGRSVAGARVILEHGTDEERQAAESAPIILFLTASIISGSP